MKKNLIGLFPIIFASGFLVGKFWNSQSHNLKSFSANETDVQKKIRSLTEKEILEYYQLKSDSEKLKSADDILGKMVLLFLYDLGIKLQPATQDLILSQIQNQKSGVDPHDVDSSSSPHTSPSQNTAKLVSSRWQDFEILRSQINDDADASRFLEKVSIKDFSETLKLAKNFANRTGQINYLNGNFYGKAQVIRNNKSAQWDIEMSIMGDLGKGKLHGQVSIKMIENGKVFSQSRGNGTLKEIKEFESESDAIIIRAAPSTYFQLYYLKNQDAFIGNVYANESEEESLIRIGTISLKKTDP